MKPPEGTDDVPVEPKSHQRTQEVIAALNVAAAELVNRIVRAEREVHDQRNAAFQAMNQAALLGDDADRLRAALITVRQLIEAAHVAIASEPLRGDLARGLATIDEVLRETGESREG
ncbi:hypothetical protein [Tautonia sociabilis]|uniref:Uncharacterized protein n=1 Tax=Tautonia sociabilis TaxID=2080755 RepID=A0A432MIA4_9BACT|nr:hypothetical protein [Tautonia sociabilis]RUL87092.1 hypothetical protein TsocGM_14250 [Tautonia sociabilis]